MKSEVRNQKSEVRLLRRFLALALLCPLTSDLCHLAVAQQLIGDLVVQKSEAFTGDITPTQLAADADNYNPTSLATASALRLSTDASRTITGLAGGADGRRLRLINVGSFNVVLANESASSTAANRFALTGALTLEPKQGIELQYDATSSRWRPIGSPAQTAGTGTVTSFSAGDLSPLFTTSEATATTTPALTFALTNAAQNHVFAGPSTGGTGAPAYRALVAADVPDLSATYQPLDSDLTAIAALNPGADQLVYYTALDTAAVTSFTPFARTLLDDTTAGDARTTLGLGTMAVASDASYLLKSSNLGDLPDATTARSNLGLANVTNDAQTLASIVPNTVPAAGQLPVGNAGGTAYAPVTASGDITITSAGVTAIGANAVALGTDTTGNYVATIADSGASEITVANSGTESAAVTLAIADGIARDSEVTAAVSAHTGDTTDAHAATAITNTPAGALAATNVQAALDELDTEKQAADADLTTYAGITPSANIQSLLGSADYSAARTNLGLAIGTNVQAYDADLDYLATFTPTANVKSILNAADYAAIRTLLDLEAGTDFNAYDLALANLAAGSNYVQFTGPTTGPRVFTLPDFNDTILSAAAVNALAPTARTSGVASYFTLTIPADSGITAATESIGLNLATATRTWATTGTVALQRERFFAGPTYASASASQTFTDAFNLYLTPPIAGTNAIFTRGHTLGIVDSTSASSSITGGLVIATTLGTSATSVGIGGGNINAGGSITAATLVGSTSITGGTISGTTGTFSGILSTSYYAKFTNSANYGAAAEVWTGPDSFGGLFLNAPTGQKVRIGINNSAVMLVDASGINGPIGATTAAAGSFTTLGASGQITHTMASPRISTVDTASANKTWDLYNNAGNLKFVEIGVADRFTLVAGIGATITGSLTTSAPSGGSAGATKLGTYTAGAPTADGYWKVEVGGAVYHVLVDAQ